MAASQLIPRSMEKPWGRRDLAPWCTASAAAPVGEMIYSPPGGDDAELLVKALFTGDRLSVQVHPDDATARAAGHRRGKDEAWIILAAAPGATIGLGLRERLTPDALAAAACDGSIEAMLDWRPVAAGDVLFAPAGTIHAIGSGITLIEVQQNLDLTYRLFDYGRPRALHLTEAIAVADAAPWSATPAARHLGHGRTALVEGPSFVIERVAMAGGARLQPAPGRPVTLAIVGGVGHIDGQRCGAGEVWLVDEGCDIDLDRAADVLLAYPGAGIAPGVWLALSEGLAA